MPSIPLCPSCPPSPAPPRRTVPVPVPVPTGMGPAVVTDASKWRANKERGSTHPCLPTAGCQERGGCAWDRRVTPRRRQRFAVPAPCPPRRALPLSPAPARRALSYRQRPESPQAGGCRRSLPSSTAKGLRSGDRPPPRVSPAFAGRMMRQLFARSRGNGSLGQRRR